MEGCVLHTHPSPGCMGLTLHGRAVQNIVEINYNAWRNQRGAE